jgi:3'-phosphoadenosine 5'-phosphosulfate sulfotransferase (PAPS reductase)/FAD synthetase
VVRVLVPISGGKDSQAALELAIQQHPLQDIRGLFCDTKWEHPTTYNHVEFLRLYYGIRIDVVSDGSVPEKVEKYGRWPGGGARHCTDELKIRPTKYYCKALAEQQGTGFEVWYGMRSGESPDRAKRYAGKVCDELYAPHEVLPSKYPKYLAKLGVMFRLCILHWSTLDVLEFLEGKENPLYAAGFPRVGCFPCGAAGDEWKEKSFAFDAFGAQQRERAKEIGIRIGKSIFTGKKAHARNPDMGPRVVKVGKKLMSISPCELMCGGN